ncbi:MAG: glycosyltransferase [Coriobacteriia bacterium]|nr:glycosyltransferase [Coriobacteriia bacterium]
MGQTVSVVIPMFNESENAADTVAAVAAALVARGWEYEIVPVNDGSIDGTAAALEALAEADPHVRPVIYHVNRGRGYALRQGFAAATGDIIAALDADLSYTTDHLVRMVDTLHEDPEADIVLASPYMPGGSVEGVPLIRLLFSRIGNAVLRLALPRKVYTSTGVVRAYRRAALRAMDLESDGKEIHLEILSEAFALGYRIVEMPATLRARKKGRSKFRPRSTVQSHLLFSVLARPATLFGGFGLALLGAGAVIGVYLLGVYLTGELNPERPLMTLMVLLLLGGAGALAFAIVASQLLEMRRSVVRLQAAIRRLSDAARDGDDA